MRDPQNGNVIRIGVTGHRFLVEVDKLAAGIDQALDRISAANPGCSLILLSALAEGADSLVAQRVLLRNPAGLVAPLPLPVEEYQNDFTTDDSLKEFQRLLGAAQQVIHLPAAANRLEAYQATGRYILENCDVLIALWDGQPAQGPGGSGQIVAWAHALQKPLAWVHCGNRKPGTHQALSLNGEQGMVSFEGF